MARRVATRYAPLVVILLFFVVLVRSPAHACGAGDQDIAVLTAPTPQYPESARSLGLGSVTVFVLVTIAPNGRLIDARVSASSGNADIDRAAVAVARSSTYSPKLRNCMPVVGQIYFPANFDPVPAPLFSSPPGWTPAMPLPVPLDWFGRWTRDSVEVVVVSGRLTKRTTAVPAAALSNSDVTVSRAVRACKGTQDAWLRIEAHKSSSLHEISDVAMLTVVKDGREYSAMYVTTDGKPADDSVMNSLLSLCAP